MAEIHSQIPRAVDGWNSAPARAAGLYGELQPLPLPVTAPLSSAMTRKARSKAALTD
ncbi:hypothetical protein [Brevundimonas sp.]|uniref:hypothetical protein n=1 Tax=Brevundimonas sp. TaxID=1871086 RepID=UPI003F722B64